MNAPKVFIGIASYQDPKWEFTATLQLATNYAARKGITATYMVLGDDALISRSRSDLLGCFITDYPEFQYYMTLDDDLVIPEDAITTLVEANCNIIGGFYRVKDETRKVAVRPLASKPDMNWIVNDKAVAEVEYVSTGIMMVRRQVIEVMIEAYPELHYFKNNTNHDKWALYQPFVYNKEYLSEDWAFCRRAIDCGYKIHAHGGVLCGHWGTKKYEF